MQGCYQIVIGASDVSASVDFYHQILGCEILEDFRDKGFAALLGGPIRISIFGGNTRRENVPDNEAGMNMVFRTEDIAKTVEEFKAKGVSFTGQIFEAPGFMKWVDLTDPDGNIVQVGQYLRDPIASPK